MATPATYKPRVLIADNSKIKFQPVMNALLESNIEVMFTPERNTIVSTASTFKPDLVLVNLFMDNSSTISVIRDLKKTLEKQAAKILVLTAHYSKDNIAECVKAGASDFILEPFDLRLLLQRIKYQLQEREIVSPEDLRSEPTQVLAGFQLTYDALKILAEVRDSNRALHEVLKRVAELSQSTRVNLILGDLESSEGRVIAASDDVTMSNKITDLEKYPEVREVLLNGSIVYIKDVNQNPLTKDIQHNVKTISITSLLVFPVRHRGETLGALSIRLGAGDGMNVSDKHLKTFYMIALALGPKVAARKLMKKLNRDG
ncbi:MAG: response regulator [Bdellovibrionales bacterium]|nr:response regulator [Bdellovibrionales bacterium]